MEVVDSDIQRILKKPYTAVLRKAKQEMSTRIEIFSDILRDRQRAKLSGIVEYGYKTSGLLEIRRAWFVKYNKPIYYQPKEFHDFLRNARHILIPRKQKPEFLSDLRDLLGRLQTTEPRVVPFCESCLREDRLTVLSRRNAIKTSHTQVSCITCAQRDLRIDLKSLGIKLSKGMIIQLEQQLGKVKSIPRLLELVSPNFDPTKDPELTLFDTIAAEEYDNTMIINQLDIPENFIKVLETEKLTSLLPIQKLVIDEGLLRDENLLVISSTSSGKTLIAELAGIPKAMKGKKMIYLSPLVALTNEKYEVFRKRYKQLGVRVGIRVGMSRLDVGSDGKIIVDTDVEKSNAICATYEALDFLLRSGEVRQLGNVGTIVIDEIQNLAEPERGPELDGLLSRLRFHYPKAQVIALSATVGSPIGLAKELGLKLVEYSGRPIPLERHVVFAKNDDEKRALIRRIVKQEFKMKSSYGNKGQSIVFTFSRRRAQDISDWLREHRVSSAVYHGGLSYASRRSIERAFSKQRFACVVTTAALGAGVDLPASQVIFESLAMGADWLTTAEFEQMLGRAGRLGKHDKGKVYLVIQPERKYHGGQEKTEDEIAAELLAGEIEDVEPFADTETSAEQILASICSTDLVDLKSIARMYNKLLSASVPPSDALKLLVRNYMIRVKEGGAYPTELGKATSLSFLTPSEGFAVEKMARKMDVLDIAIKLEPFENVYFSNKLQAEINSAFKTFMPTRLFSGIFSDLTDVSKPNSGAARLPKWVFELFGKWTNEFFNCGCRDYPECDHGHVALGQWIVKARKRGLNPSGIAMELQKKFELWAYPGDILSWLDTLIHKLQAVKRIAAVAGKTDLDVEIEGQIERIETPLKFSSTEGDEKDAN